MIEAVRSNAEYREQAGTAADHELVRAAQGLLLSVSTRAASRYLGKHVDTLGEWRRREPPVGPPFEKGPDGQGVANEHVSYPYAAMVSWKESRASKTAKERKLLDELERIRQRSRELELQLALEEEKDKAAKLTKKLGRMLSFDSLAECLKPQDWTFDGVHITGHVQTVDADSLAAALAGNGILTATLEQALQVPWLDADTRAPFADAFGAVLDEAQEHLRLAQRQQQASDLDRKWSTDIPEAKPGPRPLASD